MHPPFGGREPSFLNPTANLVSTRKEESRRFAKGVRLAAGRPDFSQADAEVRLFVLLDQSSTFLFAKTQVYSEIRILLKAVLQ